MKTLRILLFAGLPSAAVLLLTGCVQLAETDATANPKYQAMLGREYALREEFDACGSKDDYPSPRVGHVLILPSPGLGGRYIVALGRIPAGSRFRIVGVITRGSGPFHQMEYVVSFPHHRIPGAEGKSVRIYNVPHWPLYEKQADPATAPQLSERYFRPLEKIKP